MGEVSQLILSPIEALTHSVICMDPHPPNKLITTKYCFLILGDDTSFFSFIFVYFSFLCYFIYFVIINLCKNYVIIIMLFIYSFIFFFSMKIIFSFSCSGMFRNVRVPGFIDAPAKMLANFTQFLLSSSATSEFYFKVF